MRAWYCLLLLAAAQPAHAGEAEPPYYGPMKRWKGIGYEQGHKHEVEKDGSWRVSGATARRGDPVSIAMYRAAELARMSGRLFVQFLGGSASGGPGYGHAVVWARVSDSPAAPTACRSKKRGTCYTADVEELLRVLGGPDGSQPGVVIADHLDEYGREVFLSGFGVAAASASPRRPAAPPPPRYIPPTAPAAARADRVPPTPASDPRPAFERVLKAQRGVRGRDVEQGWTITD